MPFAIGHKINIGNKWNVGKKRSIKSKLKQSKTAKRVGVGKWNIGKIASKETRKKLSIAHKGNKSRTGQHWKWSRKVKKKIGMANKGKKDNIEKCHKRIIKEMNIFIENGYRCVPTGGKVRPDFIAIKNGKVSAVEVEYSQNKPRYEKYNKEAKSYFDDVIWILRKP